MGLAYANATPTVTLAHSAKAVDARLLPPQYAAAKQGGLPWYNLTDAAVYAPIKAAFTPLLAAAPAQVGWLPAVRPAFHHSLPCSGHARQACAWPA